jgi:hypothetical protein
MRLGCWFGRELEIGSLQRGQRREPDGGEEG